MLALLSILIHIRYINTEQKVTFRGQNLIGKTLNLHGICHPGKKNPKLGGIVILKIRLIFNSIQFK
jgi:hypothetical protein